jgi:hypothetical protein
MKIIRRGLPDEESKAFPANQLAEGRHVSVRFSNGLDTGGAVRMSHENWLVVWQYPSTIWADDVAEIKLEDN